MRMAKTIYFITCLVIFCALNAKSQDNCENVNSLITEYLKSNSTIKNLDYGIKIKYLNNVIDQQQWKINSKGSFTLPYSKSIESIVQPDGNVQYIPRNYVTPIANITTTKKIVKTGGEIGFTGSMDFFRNFINNNKQFNANWVNFYVSQPLFSYNQFKFEKVKQRLELSNDSINYYINRELKTKAFVEKLLDYESKILQIDEAGKSIKTTNFAIDKIKILVENGRALGIDTLILANSREQAIANQQKLVESSIILKAIISNYLGRTLNASLCSNNKVQLYNLDSNILIPAYLKYNFSKELIIDSFVSSENIKKAKKTRGITTSINAGLGANQTATNFNQLFTDPSQRQNISLSTSIPITGWDNYLRKKEVALLEATIFENNKNEILFSANTWYLEKVGEYNFLLKSYQQLLNKLEAFEKIGAIQFEKVMAGKTSSTDYNNTISQINSTKLEIIDILKNAQLFRFEIRSKTLIDLENNAFIY
jgi:hypothetical protein